VATTNRRKFKESILCLQNSSDDARKCSVQEVLGLLLRKIGFLFLHLQDIELDALKAADGLSRFVEKKKKRARKPQFFFFFSYS